MWISEVFRSLQGEGQYAGAPSAFIRTSGCNLRCVYCDTPETSWQPVGAERSIESLVRQVEEFACEHVVLTGGEPLLVPEIVALSADLTQRGFLVTIETAGTVFRAAAAHLFSISPKLSNSTPRGTAWEARHDGRRHRPEVVRQLMSQGDYQLKFVVDRPADLVEIEHYLAEFPEVTPERIYLMPQGVDAESLRRRMEFLQPAAAERGWQVSPRLHIELFGHTRGT